MKKCKYGEWASWISFDISKDDIKSRTTQKTCVKNGAQAFGKSFYDYLKEDGDPAITQIDLSGKGGYYYDESSFCSSDPNGEYGFKVLLELVPGSKYENCFSIGCEALKVKTAAKLSTRSLALFNHARTGRLGLNGPIVLKVVIRWDQLPTQELAS